MNEMKNEARAQCITGVIEIINRQKRFSTKVLNKQCKYNIYRGVHRSGHSRVSVILYKIGIAPFPVHYLRL